VVPYDHTRIKLDIENNGNLEQNDYINASLIQTLNDNPIYSEFKDLNKRYISTQGCLQNTVDDFWHMVSCKTSYLPDDF
jgi:protein tyrosine phosphatase